MAITKDDGANARAKACMAEVQAVLARHGFVLGHEDSHGAFMLLSKESMDDSAVQAYVAWLDGFYVESQ